MLQRKKLELSSIKPVLSAKWSTPVLIEGYTPFPKRLLPVYAGYFHGRGRNVSVGSNPRDCRLCET